MSPSQSHPSGIMLVPWWRRPSMWHAQKMSHGTQIQPTWPSENDSLPCHMSCWQRAMLVVLPHRQSHGPHWVWSLCIFFILCYNEPFRESRFPSHTTQQMFWTPGSPDYPLAANTFRSSETSLVHHSFGTSLHLDIPDLHPLTYYWIPGIQNTSTIYYSGPTPH